MKSAIARATMFVMGIFAYLIFSITLYQNAWAGTLGEELSIHTVGGLYELYEDEASELYVVYAVAGSMNAAIMTRAMEECRIDEKKVDWTCQQSTAGAYQKIVSEYVEETGRTPNNIQLTEVVFLWAIDLELEEYMNIALVVNGFLQNAINYYKGEIEEGTTS